MKKLAAVAFLGIVGCAGSACVKKTPVGEVPPAGAVVDGGVSGEVLGVVREGLAATTPPPAGSIPPALPASLWVGLGDTQNGATWMKSTGVKWLSRYRYLVTDSSGGWATNWCSTCPRDGRFATRYMDDSASGGFLPTFTYYVVLGLPGGGESATYAKLRVAATMRAYFNDFKLLMQVIKNFGRPVIVHLEPDGWANIEVQAGHNPNAYAAVAASGMPELAGLPNTVAGWGLAFLQIKKSVGASNAMLGVHVSGWASGSDVIYYSTADTLSLHVDKVAAYLRPAGLAPNVTGLTHDLLFFDSLDRDADFHRINTGSNRWWLSTDDTAPINSASWNRWVELLRLYNVAFARRSIPWQTPWGGLQQRNVKEDGSRGSGYKSGHVDWMFGASGAAHREKLGAAGVIGILLGAGATGQSTHLTSVAPDGRLWSTGPIADYLKPVCTQPPPVCTTPPPVCTPGSEGGLPLPR